MQLVQGHRTKAEMAVRAQGESELLTGVHLKEMPEVKKNPVAHKEFARIKKLLKSIGKDDDLYGSMINLHCLLHAECKEIEENKEMFRQTLLDFEEQAAEEDMPFSQKMDLKMKLQKQVLDCDKALKDKRKMLIDISKENIMTIQSALRSVPKTPETKSQSKMASFLQKRGIGNAT
ncbi:hypothetical protein [Ectobacillus ponti]|uniref:Uncharacterized protein n=1 Tax=Ectobacillus ponti TaxID=2961894 RepID=A0AA41XED3_9BACI|nr:hypothetical protein [Ectobacillus ponti]MCP8970561.1 hypothetical protein [Ectobacillus ponti]